MCGDVSNYNTRKKAATKIFKKTSGGRNQLCFIEITEKG